MSPLIFLASEIADSFSSALTKVRDEQGCDLRTAKKIILGNSRGITESTLHLAFDQDTSVIKEIEKMELNELIVILDAVCNLIGSKTGFDNPELIDKVFERAGPMTDKLLTSISASDRYCATLEQFVSNLINYHEGDINSAMLEVFSEFEVRIDRL